jgi:predicted ATP-dependent serine protease
MLGRGRELAGIDAWLAGVPAAIVPGLLVIAGEPGIGKTTLWAEGVAHRSGVRP